jgi:hypothetical protein
MGGEGQANEGHVTASTFEKKRERVNKRVTSAT